jgi:hypothetical protein
MSSSEPQLTFPLNPLAFPVETDMRFRLLLIAAAGTTFGLANYAIYAGLASSVDDKTANVVSTIGALVIVLLLFGVAHQRAKRAAGALVEREQWATFPPPGGDALAQASLQRMRTHVDQIVQRLPAVAAQRLHFSWNDSSADRQETAGVAFGYRDRQHLCLNEGMHPTFLSAPRTKRFHSVLLHELGHIANRDVSRTTFSIELGRTFTQLVPVLATITIGSLLFHLSRRFMSGANDQNDVTVLGTIIQIAVSAVLITALIEIIRASVLRVREYYADACARQWLGSAAPLIEPFEQRPASSSVLPARASPAASGIVEQRGSPAQRSLRRLARKYLAPLHPSNKRRIHALTSPGTLFEVNMWTAFVASLLVGLAVSANTSLLNLPLELGSAATGWLAETMTVEMDSTVWLALLALARVIDALGYIGFVVLFVIFCLVPLVGTVGVMVQRAAFVDRTAHRQKRLLPLRRLVLLALLIGSGVVLGGTLTPTAGVLSLQNTKWLLAPAFVGVWAVGVFIWLLPMRWLAGLVYRSHVGPTPPTKRRRYVAVLAGLAIAPTALFTLLGQGALVTADLNATSAELLPGLILGWLVSLPLSWVIWGGGTLLMRLAGWFGPARCPTCGKSASHTKAITLHCTHCGEPLIAWAVTPAPIALPPLPPLPTLPSGDTPPALNGSY